MTDEVEKATCGPQSGCIKRPGYASLDPRFVRRCPHARAGASGRVPRPITTVESDGGT